MVQLAIQTKCLSKSFKQVKKKSGLWNNFKSYFLPTYDTIAAVNSLSLSVAKGERVAFIGPNGAGKSTTIKMLTGILHPSSGSIEVLGHAPWKERKKLAYKIGTVFGQRSQLWYNLSPKDSFDVIGKIYDLDPSTYLKRLHDLSLLFELNPFMHVPVKRLSLGQRMRCEIVASLFHRPEILFLDEPTIGLDVAAKMTIRSLLNEMAREFGTTLFLTSHDTADIEHVCDRVIILNKGSLLLDCSVATLKQRYTNQKTLKLLTEEKKLDFSHPGVSPIKNENYEFVCIADTRQISLEELIHIVSKQTSLRDITIENASLDEIIQDLYRNA